MKTADAETVTDLLTGAQMRAVEQGAIAAGNTSGLVLMERAAKGFVAAVYREWDALFQGRLGKPTDFFASKKPYTVCIYCGPGNNGGDGFAIAQLLERQGWKVLLRFLGKPDKLPPDAAEMYRRWQAVGHNEERGRTPDLVIDALFGTGLTRPLEGQFAKAVSDISRLSLNAPCVSVDLPSGLCADSGRVLGVAVHADLTVATGPLKLGHVLADGPRHCGRVTIADLGVGADPEDDAIVRVVTPASLDLPDMLRKSVEAHKFDYGHALVIAGGPGHGGAARLAAAAALRIGAGAVTVAPPPEAMTENAARLDAVMVQSVPSAEVLTQHIADRKINALCIGPALGHDARALALLDATLAARLPVVIDADALSLLARNETLQQTLHSACVLTPHMGEFRRLAPDLAEKLSANPERGPAYSRADAARDLARRWGCVVVLKGADSIIAEPSGQVLVNAAVYDQAAPWLATAGAGDVLAGIILGLLARGQRPLRAAAAATWIHAEAGRIFGPGLTADDLPQVIPKVLARLAV